MNVSCPDCRSIFRVDPAKVPPNGVRARCSVCSGVISIPAPSGQATPPSGSAPTATPPAPSTAPTGRPNPTPRSTWNEGIFSSAPPREIAPPTPPRSAPAGGTGEPANNVRQRPDAAERTTASATATPPSATSGLPEFTPPPIAPPFRPSAPAQIPNAPTFSTPPAAQPFVPAATRPSTPARPPSTPTSMSPFGSPTTPSTGTPSAAGDSGVRRPLNPFLSKDPNQRAKRLARALVSDIITYHPAKHAEGLRDGTLKQLFREEIKKSFEEYIAQVGQQLAESTTYFQEALNEVLGAGKKIF
jgi:predicted Zn finger-like uncharacterized protein